MAQTADDTNLFGGSINITELKDVKVKLYRKENELKEAKEKLDQMLERLT
jgi:hypothetical protein